MSLVGVQRVSSTPGTLRNSGDGQSVQEARRVLELLGQEPGGGSEVLMSREVARGRLSEGGTTMKEGAAAGRRAAERCPRYCSTKVFSALITGELHTRAKVTVDAGGQGTQSGVLGAGGDGETQEGLAKA